MANTSLAARTREAVRERPFLHEALRAGVVNYTAAARLLDVDGEVDAIATALGRYAEDLDARNPPPDDVRVSMRSGIAAVEAGAGSDDGDDGAASVDPLLAVGDRTFAADGGSLTAVVASGDVSADALRRVLGRLATADVEVAAAGVGADALVVVVERRVGADALRAVESALGA